MLALGLGILVAAVGFTLLTAAVNVSAIEVRGTVAKNWRSAYDILVRPAGSETSLERKEGLVSPNFIAGIRGGITLRQWHEILRIPGIAVAAPIENIGYLILHGRVRIPIGRYLSDAPVQAYRVRLKWLGDNGLSHYPGLVDYVYARTRSRARRCRQFGGIGEFASAASPFRQVGPRAGYLLCVSLPPGGLTAHEKRSPRLVADAQFPVFLAGVDPTQENRLLHLNHTLVNGYLRAGFDRTSLGSNVPVIASTRTYVDEPLRATIQRLVAPPGRSMVRLMASRGDRQALRKLPGRLLGHYSLSDATMYRQTLRLQSLQVPNIADYWSTSSIRYDVITPNRVAVKPRESDPVAAWSDPQGSGGFAQPPPGNQDVQLRAVTIHNVRLNRVQAGDGEITITGRFDPARLPGFSTLSAVPLESYSPPEARPGDRATERLLGRRPLLPSMNLGGYINQPPFLFTTLEGARGFLSPRFFHGGNYRAPISVIRVRVRGVTGPNAASRARIRQAAQLIEQRTGLSVDIVAGSSPHPMRVEIPAGRYGRPPLTVKEPWSKKGVAVSVLQALDKKSLGLFFLVLLASGTFVANASFASVRSRRGEIGMLSCMGWSRSSIFAAILQEVALVGLAAGTAGALFAIAMGSLFHLHLGILRALLVIPIGVALAVIAGLMPALRAAEATPLQSVLPDVIGGGRAHQSSRFMGLAMTNILRVPSRSALGVSGLFFGAGALTFLLGIDAGFHHLLVGSLLGHYVSIQVRGVDLVSVGLVMGLGALSVADVLFVNLRERAAEFVTLRTCGWSEGHVARVVSLEALWLGLIGSGSGAALGVAATALVHGVPLLDGIQGAGISLGAGVLAALVACLGPAVLVGRLTPPTVLAQE